MAEWVRRRDALLNELTQLSYIWKRSTVGKEEKKKAQDLSQESGSVFQ